ncbi:hypothetical protein UMZ34_24090 [Halopseudomonas pachastrellae]|nr:hypothetical protein UMZ34_24090 [Halopseudomonas pachastrellae]
MTTVQEPVDNWITGSDKVHTTAGTIASGEVLAARTPLGRSLPLASWSSGRRALLMARKKRCTSPAARWMQLPVTWPPR